MPCELHFAKKLVTFPGDVTDNLRVNVIGDVNEVDTLAQGEPFQIDVARKPTVLVGVSNRDGDEVLSFGGLYDESNSDKFFADNVNLFGQVRSGELGSEPSELHFDVEIKASVVPEPGSWLGWLLLAGVAMTASSIRRVQLATVACDESPPDQCNRGTRLQLFRG